MNRTLELELMTDERRARAYAQADFAESHQWFVDQFVADFAPALGQAVNLGCGPAVFVMDLMRPRTGSDARRIVEQVAQHEDPILKDDFFSSLCAAFTVAEVEKQLPLVPRMPATCRF